MRYYLDTEFYERGADHPLQLISIALVSEDGREFYAETVIDRASLSPWLKLHVVPQLSTDGEAREAIRRKLLAFVGPDAKPEFWAYFADYDWVVFCQLFGTMMDLPGNFPMYCNDLKQEMRVLKVRREELPEQKESDHHALHDARWCKAVGEFLIERSEEGKQAAARREVEELKRRLLDVLFEEVRVAEGRKRETP